MNALFGFCTSLLIVTAASAEPLPAQTAQVETTQALAQDPGHPGIPLAIWAPSSGSGLGLIVMSHGTGAGAIAHIDTAQALANAGFVVVAPMHPGDNFQDDSSVGKPQWFVDRSRHISKVLDYMLTQWPGHARIDPARIGMFGMSAGATTSLVLSGGTIDLAAAAEHCRTKPEFVCQILAPTDPHMPSLQLVRDKRIAAQVLAAPGLGFAFEPSSLKSVTIPTQLWAGSDDQTVPYATNSGVIRTSLGRDVEFHSVENAVHLSFLAPCGPQSPPVICQDRPGFDRTAFHARFNQDIVGFFQDKLPNKPQP